jgi:hypothetical protein
LYNYGNEPQHMSTVREAATENVDLGVAKDFGPERLRTAGAAALFCSLPLARLRADN